MIKYTVILYFVSTFVTANQNEKLSSNINSNQPAKGEDMNKKIKTIARGIVDKWIDEGLTVTREKVEGWISKIDEAHAKDKQEMTGNSGKAVKEDTKPNRPENELNNLGDNFEDVKKTVVNTFTKIGQVRCKNCKKSDEDTAEYDHSNELPEKSKTITKRKMEDLENLSVEELIKKQEAIKQFLQMEKMAKLANVANDFSEIDKLKNIANLASTFKTLSKTTAKEEL